MTEVRKRIEAEREGRDFDESEKAGTEAVEAEVARSEEAEIVPEPETVTTRKALYEKASELDIAGRSSMSKDELAEAVEAADEGEDE